MDETRQSPFLPLALLLPLIAGCPAAPDPDPVARASESGRSMAPHALSRSWSELGEEGFRRARANLKAPHHLLRAEALEAIERNGWAARLEGREVEDLHRVMREEPERNRSWALLILLDRNFVEALPLAADLLASCRSPGTRDRVLDGLNRLAPQRKEILRELAEKAPRAETRHLARRLLQGPLSRR